MTGLPPYAADAAVLDEQGLLWLPTDDGDHGWHLHNGLRLRWLPLDQPGRVIIQLIGGAHRTEEEERDFEKEGIVVGLMRADLRRAIAQLQAIDAMLEDE